MHTSTHDGQNAFYDKKMLKRKKPLKDGEQAKTSLHNRGGYEMDGGKSMSQTPAGLARFGLSDADVGRYQERFRVLIATMPATRTERPDKRLAEFELGDDLLDWEAALLRKVLDRFKGADPDVCALICRLMQEVGTAEGVEYRFPRTAFLERKARESTA